MGLGALCLSRSTPYKPEHFQNSAWGIECYSKATPPAKGKKCKCKCIYLWLMAFLISNVAGEGILHPCVTPAPQYQSCGHTWNLLQTMGFPSSLSDSPSFIFFSFICIFPLTPAPKSPCVLPDAASPSMSCGFQTLPIPCCLFLRFLPLSCEGPAPRGPFPSWGCCGTHPLHHEGSRGCVLLRNSC